MTNQGTKFKADGSPDTTTTRCAYYQAESQNVKARGECLVTDGAPTPATGTPTNILTGPQAATYKATIQRQGNRWYNNNEQPPDGVAGCPTNNGGEANGPKKDYYDSCWCARNARNENVAWVESKFAYGAPQGATAAGRCKTDHV